MIVICTHNTYTRTESGKSWRARPRKTTVSVMREEIYLQNFQSPDRFMKALGGSERIYKGYTYAGYTAVKVVCIAPGGEKKSERLFKIYRDEADLLTAGKPEEIATYKEAKNY